MMRKHSGTILPFLSLWLINVEPFFLFKTARPRRCQNAAAWRNHNHNHNKKALPLNVLFSSGNPNDSETPEERAERMKLVRKIQKSFYTTTADGSSNNPDGDNNDFDAGFAASIAPTDDDDGDPAILENVPLWRVQWTELPGYQNVLNCHVPHYTHMFRQLMSKPKPWLFGHLFLPKGSENLNNPQYRLPDSASSSPPSQATLVGTLMQVTDCKEQLEDGRLTLIVQALERFQVLHATQHAPYAMATIQLDPDLEALSDTQQQLPDDTVAPREGGGASASASAAVRENLEWREWEFRPTLWKEVETSRDGISPLTNYDGSYFPNEIVTPQVSSQTRKEKQDEEQQRKLLASLEHNVWLSLDTLLQLLAQINPGMRIPVPSQLLGLLPLAAADDGGGTISQETMCWPEGFQLEKYATKLQQSNANIGTSTKSPFVRTSENRSYPLYRRAARLSYAIWIVLGSIRLPNAPNGQQILEETSIANRLKMAHEALEAVNDALRQTL